MAVELTVIVKGEDGKLLSGATVSATPGGASETTNEAGEAKITVDGADRYEVTISAGDAEQTVPYYVIDGQTSARLDVNLQYFKQMKETKALTTQSAEPTQPWYQTDIAYIGFGVVAVLLLVFVVIKLLRRHRESNIDGRIYGPDPVDDVEEESVKSVKTEKPDKSPHEKPVESVEKSEVSDIVKELDKLEKPTKKAKTTSSTKKK